jgi:hypothetical protein
VAVQQIGDIGSRLDLVMRQGATFGPVKVQLRNPGSTPIDLTGCTVEGGVRRRVVDQQFMEAFNVQMIDARLGQFRFGLTNTQTEALVRNERSYERAQFFWELRLTDSQSNVRSLFYGDVLVYLGSADGGG